MTLRFPLTSCENAQIQCLKFVVALATGKKAIEIISLDGPLPGNPVAREEISEPIRSRLATGEVQAVVFSTGVLTGKQEAVVVAVESPMFRRVLRQDYSRAGRAIKLGEYHTNDDPAIARQMIGDFFQARAKK